MKKTYLYLLVFTLIFAACSKEDTVVDSDDTTTTTTTDDHSDHDHSDDDDDSNDDNSNNDDSIATTFMLTASINGADFKTNSVSGTLNKRNGYDIISIEASEGGETLHLDISLKNGDTVSIGEKYNSVVEFVSSNGAVYSSNEDDALGTIKVETIDSTNNTFTISFEGNIVDTASGVELQLSTGVIEEIKLTELSFNDNGADTMYCTVNGEFFEPGGVAISYLVSHFDQAGEGSYITFFGNNTQYDSTPQVEVSLRDTLAPGIHEHGFDCEYKGENSWDHYYFQDGEIEVIYHNATTKRIKLKFSYTAYEDDLDETVTVTDGMIHFTYDN